MWREHPKMMDEVYTVTEVIDRRCPAMQAVAANAASSLSQTFRAFDR